MDKKTEQELLGLVKQNYEQIAAGFNETRRKALWPEIAKLAGEVKYGQDVLDVGCGNGRLREAFKGKPINYLGIDLNQNLIQLAEANDERKLIFQQFKVGDILELDRLTDKKFNYIFSVAVLHHLPGINTRLEALAQLKNCLKPDGMIIISVWNMWKRVDLIWLIIKFGLKKLTGQHQMDWGDVVFDWRGEKTSQRYYHAFTKKELIKLCKLVDFKIDRFIVDDFNYYLIISAA
jgi:2-polyprenyl-3-methyl-5-hydroxy-6-metoxy-1,4-benzoquinol methylase